MKRIICCVIALCMLAGFATAGAESQHFEGKPWMNSNFFGLWPAERPAVEETFELYANYDLYQEALAKGERKIYTPIDEAQRLEMRQMAAICTDPDLTGPEAECMRILYRLYTGTKQGREAFAPLLPYAERLRSVKTLEELNALIREDGWLYGEAFYKGILSTEERESGKYYVFFSQTEPIEYLPFDEETFDLPGKDTEGAKEKLLCLGWNEEEVPQLIEKVLDVYDYSKSRDEDPYTEREKEFQSRQPQMFSLNEIREVSPVFCELIKARGLAREGAEEEPAYQINITELIKNKTVCREENLETVKAILALSMYNGAEKAIPKDAAEGTEDPTDAVNRLAPLAVREQGYVHNFVSRERIDMYNQLAEEYKDALRARIEKNDWLSDETKQEICRKIDRLVAADILYPGGEFDCTPLLESLRSCDNIIEAYGLCSRFQHQCEARFAGMDWAPGNRFGKHSTLKAEGGYYPEENVFYVGGASLCDITLDMTSRETILGTFGAHISHEFCHAFDTTGSKYNADFTGSLFATEKDREIFEQKAAAIAKQVSSIEVLDGVCSNGTAQIGEILADLTGMSLTMDIAKETENFDYDKYFRAFAYFFSQYLPSREDVEPGSADNTHPYCSLRINFAVQHFDEFYRTYPSVTEGTPMYLAPEERLLVW